jgi:hypothetical protein
MFLRDIENSIYDSLIIADNDKKSENITDRLNLCVYLFAIIVALMIIAFFIFLSIEYFGKW